MSITNNNEETQECLSRKWDAPRPSGSNQEHKWTSHTTAQGSARGRRAPWIYLPLTKSQAHSHREAAEAADAAGGGRGAPDVRDCRRPHAGGRAGSTFPAHWPKPTRYPSPWQCPGAEKDRVSHEAAGHTGHHPGGLWLGPRRKRWHVFQTEESLSPEAKRRPSGGQAEPRRTTRSSRHALPPRPLRSTGSVAFQTGVTLPEWAWVQRPGLLIGRGHMAGLPNLAAPPAGRGSPQNPVSSSVKWLWGQYPRRGAELTCRKQDRSPSLPG